MGNMVSPCGRQTGGSSTVKLIFWEGNTRDVSGRHMAGEIMFEFPDRMVCHADSFFIGRPIPVLNIEDELMPGETYFVLPLDHFSCTNVLSAASLAALVSSPKKPPTTSTSSATTPIINFKEFSPFEYIKDLNGRVLIKVMPEFMAKLITRGQEIIDGKTTRSSSSTPSRDFLCSTPELKKQYDQLVGDREQLWSPKLETISEFKPRHSPCRFIGLERKHK